MNNGNGGYQAQKSALFETLYLIDTFEGSLDIEQRILDLAVAEYANKPSVLARECAEIGGSAMQIRQGLESWDM